MGERTGLLLPERVKPRIDEDQYARYMEVIDGDEEVYRIMKLGPEQAAKVFSAWQNGECANLSTESVDLSKLRERWDRYRQYKSELIQDKTIPPQVKQAYRWRINEQIANIGMVLASQGGKPDVFRRMNEFIYGKVNAAVYHNAIDKFAADAEAIMVGDYADDVKAAALEVLQITEGLRGDRKALGPTPEVFQAVREHHMRREKGYYALLLAGVEVPQEGKITNAIGDPILERVVRENLKSDYPIQDSSDNTWGVVHSKEKRGIERPATYAMVPERYIGLGLGHEIGSHLLERVNGARGPLALAEDGLDRTELGNEGRALIREQVVYGTFEEFAKTVRWRDVLRREVAIGFAAGTDNPDDVPHNSADTYAFMNAIDYMYKIKLKPGNADDARRAAAETTKSLLLRVLKGTDGRGGAYLKDKVYLEGNVACWENAAVNGPEVIANGDLGKWDINNPRIVMLLQQLGVLPTDTAVF